jgi:predicted RNA-binding protein (virulence factor B family)
MALIGKRSTLPIVREATPGFYLDAGPLGEILLPGRYVPAGVHAGQSIEVFVYRDSEDRLVATTETPYAMVGEFAYLRVVSFNPRLGAFLDWGLEKDLLLPMRELGGPVSRGDWVLVHVELDPKTTRIVASGRINRYLNLTEPAYAKDQPVKLIVASETPLGYAVIIEQAHRGLLYRNNLAGRLTIGQTLDGFVRTVRPDGKIDVALDRAGYERIEPLTEKILEAMKAAGGALPLSDSSSPEEIRAALGVSKKAFKQAIGALYRDRLIVINAREIRLVPPATGKPKTPASVKPPPRRTERRGEV